MTTSVGSPPATYLPGGFVTDVNRQALWESLTDSQRASYQSTSTTGSGTTTGATSGTGSTSSSTPTFKSLGSSTGVSSATFTGRTDARSVAPNSTILSGYGSLWDPTNLVSAQLATLANGGAIFVGVQAGTIANGDRPQDGTSGDLANIRGQNPFGYFDGTEFVKVLNGTETRFSGNPTTDPSGYATWLSTARVRYDAYQSLVSTQITDMQSLFGKSLQGLLGFDVNNNGLIDNEAELFGFDAGLDIDGSASIKYGTGASQTTASFTFLAANGRLAGDPLDPQTDTASLDEYRRFMVLTETGQSVAVLQSDIGYDPLTGSYVKAQTRLQLDAAGGASLTVVAQNGFTVTPTYTSPISATGYLPTIAEVGRPQDGASGNLSNLRGQNPYGYFQAGLFYKFDAPGATGGTATAFDPVLDPTGYTSAVKDYNDFETFLTNQRTSLLASLGTGPFDLGFDVDGNGSLAATEYFGAGLNLYGQATLNDGKVFRFLTGSRLSGDPLSIGALAGDGPYYSRFMFKDAGGTVRSLDQGTSQLFTAMDGLSSFSVASRAALEILANGQFRINIVTELGPTVTAT